MKDISAQIGMKGVATFAVMDRTAPAILIAAAAAQGHLATPQHNRQPDAFFDGCKIHPVSHGCLRHSGRARGGARFCAHRNRPDETEQFPAYGGNNLVLILPPRGEFVVTVVQPPLRFSGEVLDLRVQALLAF